MPRRPRMTRAAVVTACLLLGAGSAAGRVPLLRAELDRGLEYHTIDIATRLAQPFWSDTLRLELGLDGRQGFRDWNRESGRLQQSLSLGWERPSGNWSWLLEGRNRFFAETFQGDRERRRTLQGDLAAGVAHRWPRARVHALAGIGADVRRESAEAGGLLRLGGESRGSEGLLGWQGKGSGTLENLDSRRNRGAALELSADYGQTAVARDEARMDLAYQREDLYLDPASLQLERRTESSTRLSNALVSRPVSWSESRLEADVWRIRQDRQPMAGPAGPTVSLTQPTRESRHEDLGLEGRVSQRAWLGDWEGRLQFSLLRQRQDSRYRSPGEVLQTTLSRIQSNRLEAGLAWQAGADSLGLESSLELRRRDTDQQRGEQARDADYTDRLNLDVSTTWRRHLAPRATLWLQAGLARLGERHLQAVRSAGNHENRRWLLEFRHRLNPVGDWRLEGTARTLAAYRLFEYESVEEPRSTLQRRWVVEEHLSSGALRGLSRFGWMHAWREELHLKAGLLLEDGGRYQRTGHLELLSDSADERTLHVQWRMSRGGLELAPGLRWFSHRDHEWHLEEGERRRVLRRDLFRRGPEFQARWHSGGFTSSLSLYLEDVADGIKSDGNLWANLQVGWEF